MANKRKSYLITTDEDINASEIANTQLSSILGQANIMDAPSAMAGISLPDDSAILTNDDFGIITANLTKTEAKEIANKTGVAHVEVDKKAFALTFDGDSGDNFVDDDPEATEDIEASEQHNELEMTDDEAIEMAREASQIATDLTDDVEFDEDGNVFAIDASEDVEVGDAFAQVGVPKDKIAALIKCIIKCAVKEISDGKAQEISDTQISALLAEQGVTGSQTNVQAIRDYITCGLKLIYAQYAWRRSTGSGVRVAVVDTGIASRHNDLRVFGGVSYVPGVRSWNDDNGHGTHVAGTIAARANNRGVVGVAPNARLYAVKVLSRNGSGSTSSVINGLTWCYRNRMHIANLSLGSGATTHNTNDYSRAYERAGRLLRNRGVLSIAAAGNSGATQRPYVGNPARCPSFMAVASVDCKRKRSSFSSFGPQVEIAAPGSGVWSTYPPNNYRKLNGTSMASPHVAGVAALVKRRYPTMHGDRIRVLMRTRATDLGRPGRDWAFGYGLVNALRSVN